MSATAFDTSVPPPSRSGIAALVLVVAVACPIFWLAFEELAAAWATPEYSHGPLIPLISLFLFLRELRDRPTVPRPNQGWSDQWQGLVVGAAALALAGVGNLMAVPDLVAYALILWIMSLVLVTMGWARGRAHWAPVLHLVFMLPLPQVIYWTLTTWLQGVSAQIGVALIDAAGIPVYLEGHIIDLGVYKLQVAEACAGLRYLFPILSFSYLTAILYRGPFTHKVILFAMAAPVAVLLNALRIGVIGVLVDRYGIGHAEGFLHLFEGWVVFGLSLAILFLTAWILIRTTENVRPMLDLDTDGLASEVAGLRSVGNARAIVCLALLSATFAAFSLLKPPHLVELPRTAFVAMDLSLGNWQGERRSLDPQVAQVLGADDYLDAVFVTDGGAASVQIFVAWYENQNGGSGLHSPTVCLPAAGWEISELDEVRLLLDGGFAANRAIISKGLRQQLVYYWFEQGGQRVTGDWQAKALGLRRSLLDGRADGALVRFVTEILPGEDIASAEQRAQQVMKDALQVLPRHLPG